MLHNAMIRRMKSRFMQQGKLPGILLTVSSALYPDDFTERRVQEAIENAEKRVFWRRYSQWGPKPKHYYSGETFNLSLGDAVVRPRVLRVEGQKDWDPELDDLTSLESKDIELVKVPIEYRPDFLKDIDMAIRDIAGYPTLATYPFFRDTQAIEDAVKAGEAKGLKHPYSQLTVSFIDEDLWIKDNLDFSQSMKPHFAHVDLAINQDAAGIAIVRLDDVEEVRRSEYTEEGEEIEVTEWVPRMSTVLLLRVVAPPGGEIDVRKVRQILLQMIEWEFFLHTVTYDQYQCLVEDTLVSTDKGLLPIKDVQVGDLVQSAAGVKPVTAVHHFDEVPTIKLTTKDGDVIEGSTFHQMAVLESWTWVKGKRQPVWTWKRLDQIQPGDVLGRAREAVYLFPARWTFEPLDPDTLGRGFSNPGRLDGWSPPGRLTDDFAEWLGLVWGDGDIGQDSVRQVVTEEEYRDAASVWEKVFGFQPEYKPRRNGHGVLSVSGRWFVRWLAAQGLEKPLVPRPILEGCRSAKASFLRGLFATDGNVDKNDGKVSFSTKHYDLAQQVRLLLLSDFGIESNLATMDRSRDQGAYVHEGTQYAVQLRGSRKAFLDAIGFTYARKERQLARHAHRKGRSIFARVDTVERGSAKVVDLTVKDHPSYMAGGFLHHNSAESIQQLKTMNVKADKLSVDRTLDPYNALKEAIYEERLAMYRHDVLIRELGRLERDLKRNKVDHPPKGSKDVSDALAGAVYNCTVFVRDHPLEITMGMMEERQQPKEYTGVFVLGSDDDEDDPMSWLFSDAHRRTDTDDLHSLTIVSPYEIDTHA